MWKAIRRIIDGKPRQENFLRLENSTTQRKGEKNVQ